MINVFYSVENLFDVYHLDYSWYKSALQDVGDALQAVFEEDQPTQTKSDWTNHRYARPGDNVG